MRRCGDRLLGNRMNASETKICRDIRISSFRRRPESRSSTPKLGPGFCRDDASRGTHGASSPELSEVDIQAIAFVRPPVRPRWRVSAPDASRRGYRGSTIAGRSARKSSLAVDCRRGVRGVTGCRSACQPGRPAAVRSCPICAGALPWPRCVWHAQCGWRALRACAPRGSLRCAPDAHRRGTH